MVRADETCRKDHHAFLVARQSLVTFFHLKAYPVEVFLFWVDGVRSCFWGPALEKIVVVAKGIGGVPRTHELFCGLGESLVGKYGLTAVSK